MFSKIFISNRKSMFRYQSRSTSFVDQLKFFHWNKQFVKMNSFKKLSQIGESKKYYGFSKLPLGFHKIICFRLIKNKFVKNESEKTIVVELDSEVLFLPSYFSKIMSEDDIKNINIDGETKYFPSVLLK